MIGAIGARGPIQPIRIGIIGFGQIGRIHLDALAGHHDARVVAVSRRHASPKDLAIDCYSDYRELLHRPDIDLVAICTPSGYHAEQALAVLKAGKGVVVEKPIALSVESGQRVIRMASERGLFLSTISQRRTEDAVRVLKEALAEGRLGRPVLGEALVRWSRDQRYYDSAPWRGTRAMDGGVLMNQAIHAIDLLCWLLGPVEEVSGVASTLVRTIEAEDTASASLHFASGALGAISATTAIAPGLPAELNLFCERGLASLHDASVARWEVPNTPRPSLEARSGSGSTDPAAIGSAGHHRQWRDILDAFRQEREPLVTGTDGLATVATILAIEESSQTGRAVRPKYIHSELRGTGG